MIRFPADLVTCSHARAENAASPSVKHPSSFLKHISNCSRSVVASPQLASNRFWASYSENQNTNIRDGAEKDGAANPIKKCTEAFIPQFDRLLLLLLLDCWILMIDSLCEKKKPFDLDLRLTGKSGDTEDISTELLRTSSVHYHWHVAKSLPPFT